MSALEKIVYSAVIIWFFVLGLLTPLMPIRKEAYAAFKQIGAFLNNSPFLICVAVVAGAAISGATMYIMGRVVRHQPIIFRTGIKLFIVGLPALVTGFIAALCLGWLGVYMPAWDIWPFLAVGALFYLCGGIGGSVAVGSTPEYKQVLVQMQTGTAEDADPSQLHSRPNDDASRQ